MRKSRSNNVISRPSGKRRLAQWLRHHHYAINNVGKALIRGRWTVAVNTVILGLSLSLPLALLSVTNHFAYFTDTFYAPNKVYIEIKQEVNQLTIEDFIKMLKQDVRVAELSFLSRDDVLDRIISQLSLEHSAEIYRINPFSDMLEVELSAGVHLKEFIDELRSNAVIANVDISEGVVASDGVELKVLFERFALILSGIVLISVLLVCGYMVRNQILRQNLEIEVTRYCGAENAFIRRPFLYWGAAQGFLGGICAGVIVFLCAALLQFPSNIVSDLRSSDATLGLIYLPEFGLTLAVATLLGFVGAWLATLLQADIKMGTTSLR